MGRKGNMLFKRLKKSLSLSVFLLFLMNTLQPSICCGLSINSDSAPPSFLSFSSSYGEIEKSSEYKSSKPPVVVIQDAHCEAGIQDSIYNILKYLADKTDGRFVVGVEGMSEGIVTPSKEFASAVKDPVQKKSIDLLFKDGRISAVEYAQLNHPDSFQVYGLENKFYYEKNRFAFVQTQNSKVELETLIEEIEASLGDLKDSFYPKDMSLIDSLFNAGPDTYSKSVFDLTYLFDKYEFKYIDYPQLSKFKDFVRSEERIVSSSKFKDELTAFSKEAGLGKDDNVMEVVHKSDSFGAISLDDYPTLKHWKTLQSVFNNIDFSLLVKEKHQMRKALGQLLYSTEFEQVFSEAMRYVQYVKDLSKMGLTFSDMKKFTDMKTEWSLNRLVKWLELNDYLSASEVQNIINLSQKINLTLSFYDAVNEREEAIVKNLDEIYKTSSTVSAVVVGGFHAAGVVEHLEQENIPYYLIMPNAEFRDKRAEEKYYEAITGQFDLKFQIDLNAGAGASIIPGVKPIEFSANYFAPDYFQGKDGALDALHLMNQINKKILDFNSGESELTAMEFASEVKALSNDRWTVSVDLNAETGMAEVSAKLNETRVDEPIDSLSSLLQSSEFDTERKMLNDIANVLFADEFASHEYSSLLNEKFRDELLALAGSDEKKKQSVNKFFDNASYTKDDEAVVRDLLVRLLNGDYIFDGPPADSEVTGNENVDALFFGGGNGSYVTGRALQTVLPGQIISSVQGNVDDGGSTYKIIEALIDAGYGVLFPPGDVVNSLFMTFASLEKVNKVLDGAGRSKTPLYGKDFSRDNFKDHTLLMFREQFNMIASQNPNILSEDYVQYLSNVLKLIDIADKHIFNAGGVDLAMKGASLRNILVVAALIDAGLIVGDKESPKYRTAIANTKHFSVQDIFDKLARAVGIKNGTVTIASFDPKKLWAEFQDAVLILEDSTDNFSDLEKKPDVDLMRYRVNVRKGEDGVYYQYPEYNERGIEIETKDQSFPYGSVSDPIILTRDGNPKFKVVISSDVNKNVFMSVLDVTNNTLKHFSYEEEVREDTGKLHATTLFEVAADNIDEVVLNNLGINGSTEDRSDVGNVYTMLNNGTGLYNAEPGYENRPNYFMVNKNVKMGEVQLVAGKSAVLFRPRLVMMQTHITETIATSKVVDVGLSGTIDESDPKAEFKAEDSPQESNDALIEIIENTTSNLFTWGPGSDITSIRPYLLNKHIVLALYKKRLANPDLKIVDILGYNHDSETMNREIIDLINDKNVAIMKHRLKKDGTFAAEDEEVDKEDLVRYDDIFTDLLLNDSEYALEKADQYKEEFGDLLDNKNVYIEKRTDAGAASKYGKASRGVLDTTDAEAKLNEDFPNLEVHVEELLDIYFDIDRGTGKKKPKLGYSQQALEDALAKIGSESEGVEMPERMTDEDIKDMKTGLNESAPLFDADRKVFLFDPIEEIINNVDYFKNIAKLSNIVIITSNDAISSAFDGIKGIEVKKELGAEHIFNEKDAVVADSVRLQSLKRKGTDLLFQYMDDEDKVDQLMILLGYAAKFDSKSALQNAASDALDCNGYITVKNILLEKANVFFDKVKEEVEALARQEIVKKAA